MHNLLILGFYGYADGYYALGQYFNSHFNTVDFFPFMKYINSIDGFKNNDLLRDINTKIRNDNITHILVWHNIDAIHTHKKYFNEIFKLRTLKPNLKFIQLDWDPHVDTPATLNATTFTNTWFDYLFYSSPFKITNSNNSFIFKAGFSPNISYYKYDIEYICDVVFIGTNLYTDSMWENKNMNRKQVIDTIAENKLINLHIYGIPSSSISNTYPDQFKGYLPYNKCYLGFSNALFSLNISPLNNVYKNGYYYYSERLPQILACNSIMISNNDYGDLLTPNVDYIYLTNLKELNNIILDFKSNPQKAEIMRNNYKQKLDNFNYEKIAKEMSEIMLNNVE